MSSDLLSLSLALSLGRLLLMLLLRSSLVVVPPLGPSVLMRRLPWLILSRLPLLPLGLIMALVLPLDVITTQEVLQEAPALLRLLSCQQGRLLRRAL